MMNLKNYSYVPYSGTSSRCVVKSLEGHFFPGVRIENASFPLTINAAQNAIFSCLSEGEQPRAIYAEDTNANDLKFWKLEYNLWTYPLTDLGDVDFQPVILEKDPVDIRATLQQLLQRSVVINSDFPVSALLETESGFISGVNIECSEWSSGLCAERVALMKAFSYGHTDIKALYIHTREGEYCSPCGACRQVILEHMPHHPVYLYHADGSRSMHFSDDLMPYSFRSSALKKNPV